MSRLFSLALLTLLFLVPPAVADPVSFTAALDDIRQQVQGGEWLAGSQALRKLLAEEGDQPHVRERRREIVDLLRRCAMRLANPPPDLEELVEGTLEEYQPRSGKIQLSYRGYQRKDFEEAGSGVWVHPLTFAGNYTLELSGPRYPGSGPRSFDVVLPFLMVCTQGDEFHQVIPGFHREDRFSESWIPATIVQGVGSRTEELGSHEKPALAPGRPYRIKVSVSDTRIQLRIDGKSVLKVRKRRDLWGGFGFAHLPEDATLTVTGKANSSWARGLVDEALREQDAVFRERFDVNRLLPEWLHEETPPPAAEEHTEQYPWPLDEIQLQNVEVIHEALAEATPAAAQSVLNSLESAPEGAFPADLRRFFQAFALTYTGRLQEALTILAGLIERTPDFAQLYILQAAAQTQLGQGEAALASLDEALERRPRDPEANVSRCQVLLLLNRRDEAREMLRRCQRLGLKGETLQMLQTMVVRADHGPNWDQRFEYQTDHYHLASDLDRRICVAAGKTLEKMHALLEERLGPAPEGSFQVYLFAGEAGYQRYAEEASPALTHSTAGIYNRYLKQLIVWNVPEREQLMQTVRHEGVHQFLDSQGMLLPTWFEEGLAEYFCYVRTNRRGDYIAAGEVYAPYVRLLRANRGKIIPLARFLELQGRAFYQLSDITYPQAWGLMHFLHSRDEYRTVVDQALRDAPTGAGVRAIRERFAALDLERLQREFLVYLEML